MDALAWRPLEREAELSQIARALHAACNGRGGVLLVEAPAGLGKTTLVRWGIRMASDRRLRVLSARGVERERDLPFGVVRQLIEPVVADAVEADRWFSGAAEQARPALETHGLDRPAAEMFAVVHGLYWLIANLAGAQPLLLAVDDVQWADAASLRFLTYLQHRVGELAVLMLIAARPASSDTEPELEALRSAPEVVRAEPGPLSAAATEELIAGAFGAAPDPEFVAACRRSAGGNPFFLKSLLAVLAEQGVAGDRAHAELAESMVPVEVRRSVLRRLAGLGPAAAALARAVAVLGSDVRVYRAARHADLEPQQAELVADRLSQAELLRSGRPLEFEHPILREAVYQQLAPGERSLAHRRAADLLLQEGCSAEQVASQLLFVSPADDQEVVVLLRRAARASVARGAPESAIRYLARALQEPAGAQRCEVLLELGVAENLLARPEAVEHLHQALAASETPEMRADAAIRLLRAGMMWGGANALALLEPFMDDLAERDPELAARVDAELLVTAGTEFADVSAFARRLARFLDAPGDTSAERIALAAGAALAQDAPSAIRLAERAFAAGRLVEDLTSSSLLPFTVCWTFVLGDRLDLAEKLLELATTDARSRVSAPGIGMASLWRSLILHRRGELERAAEEAQFGLDLNVELGTGFGISWHRAALLAALVDRGCIDDARAVLDGTAITIRNTGDQLLAFHHGRLLHAEGRHAEAVSQFDQLAGVAESSPRDEASIPHHAAAVRSLIALGDQAAATTRAQQALQLAERWGTSRAIGTATHMLALASPKDVRLELLEAATERLAATSAPLEQAAALLDLGAERRRLGERVRAREILRDAEELATVCGAGPLVERAREELAAAGARARKVMRSGADALTPGERRVARLALEGRTNPEIAQQLFVTARTVETHLRHVYQKLGVSSRRELAGALDRSRA